MKEPKFEFANYFLFQDRWVVRVVCRPPADPQVRRHTLFYETISEMSAKTLCWCLMGDDAPTEPSKTTIVDLDSEKLNG